MTYRIVRLYERTDKNPRTIKRGLTLEDAEQHCNSAEASSRTCTSTADTRYLQKVMGHWKNVVMEEK